jgi:hypothetical protein
MTSTDGEDGLFLGTPEQIEKIRKCKKQTKQVVSSRIDPDCQVFVLACLSLEHMGLHFSFSMVEHVLF